MKDFAGLSAGGQWTSIACSRQLPPLDRALDYHHYYDDSRLRVEIVHVGRRVWRASGARDQRRGGPSDDCLSVMGADESTWSACGLVPSCLGCLVCPAPHARRVHPPAPRTDGREASPKHRKEPRVSATGQVSTGAGEEGSDAVPSHPPLAGLKVIDASSVIAGPLAAMLLGDYGADVVKIEPPEHGDPMRDHGPYAHEVPLWWKMLGRNKHSVRCDLRTADGRERFREIAAEADVVILSFRPSTLERWGLTPDQLRELNPSLVVGCISGYGDRGPLADAGGFGTMAESMSGFAHRNGFPDGPPTLPPFGLADGVAGMSLALGVCMALLGRRETGAGQVVRVSLLDPLLTILAPQNALHHALGTVAGRIGNRSAASAPRNLYVCGDGNYVAISCSTFSTAKALVDLIGRP